MTHWLRSAALAAGLMLAGVAAAQSSDDAGRFFVLDNGLRVFLYEKHDLPLLHVVAAFDVGSKDEADATNGLVHLLEHCVLFRGTGGDRDARSADIRGHGAYFNATTGPDLSVFELSLGAEHAAFALRFQKELLFGFDLGQRELDEEKEVILEEFSQMEDDPQRLAADLVLRALFPEHPYGRSAYGRREVILAATVETLLGFHRRFFVADNCALAVVGDFARADMEKLVRAEFGGLPRRGHVPADLPMAGQLKKATTQRLERDVQDGYVVIGLVAPDYNSPDQHVMNVLAEVLGRGVNPLLPVMLYRERNTLQSLSMSYLPLRFGGAAVLSIKVDPKDARSVERAAASCLKRAHNEAFSKKDFPAEAQMEAFDYLESAKNQIRFAVGQSEELGLQLAGSLARHMLLNTREKRGRFLDEVAKVDSSDLRKAASRYLAKGEFATVVIVPRKAGRQ